MGLAAIAAHKLGGIIPVGAIFKASVSIGQIRRSSSKQIDAKFPPVEKVLPILP
jgi:hypothetical protein